MSHNLYIVELSNYIIIGIILLIYFLVKIGDSMKAFYNPLILLFLVLLNTQFIYSQWVQTNGPGEGT